MQPHPQLVAGHVPSLPERDSAGVAEDLAQRPVGDAVAGGEAASAEHPGVRSRLQGSRDHLAYEPALPDAGDPDDGDEARPAAGRGLADEPEPDPAPPPAPPHRRLDPGPPPSPRPARCEQAPANQRPGAGAAEP